MPAMNEPGVFLLAAGPLRRAQRGEQAGNRTGDGCERQTGADAVNDQSAYLITGLCWFRISQPILTGIS
jgi:hypothetical protein